MTIYIEVMNARGTIYIRNDILTELAKVDTIVFDCDGVLLDVRNAYNVAIAATTKIIIEAFTGTVIPKEMFDSKLNHYFKRTGGFNNDWSHAYAIIMRLLFELHDDKLSELNKLARESLSYSSPKDRFDYMSNKIVAEISTDYLYEKLMDFASKLDATGIERVDELLLPRVGVDIKNALKYKGEVGESIISTLFEELFTGEELFEESFGLKPIFVRSKKGIVEAEEVVINEKTLDELVSILGGPRFGIASGSLENTAQHVLKEIKYRFPRRSQYWHDVVDRDAKMLGESNLHKPNPYSLLKASESFEPKKTLFIGDTMADYLTAENAGRDFMFAAVYASVHNSDAVRDHFIKIGCPVVAPTVNEMPAVLRYAKDSSMRTE